jgi:hypothetical protein
MCLYINKMSTEENLDDVVKHDNGDDELIEYANNDVDEDVVNEEDDVKEDDDDDDDEDDNEDEDEDEEHDDEADDEEENKDESKDESKESIQDDTNKFKNCLMATIRIPIRVDADGSFDMLDGYGEITIDKIEGEMPVKTDVSLFSKLAEYMQSHPEFISEIIKEDSNKEEEEEDDEEDDDEDDDNDDEDEDDDDDDEEEEDEEVSKISPETELHDFPYLKKSKKPLNTSFRSKPRSLNHSKKNYDDE